MARTSQVKRSTSETQIEVSLNLDGTGIQDIQTPVPFWIICCHNWLDTVILT
jgi:imidazoleglycerol-phosphate dehydratase